MVQPFSSAAENRHRRKTVPVGSGIGLTLCFLNETEPFHSESASGYAAVTIFPAQQDQASHGSRGRDHQAGHQYHGSHVAGVRAAAVLLSPGSGQFAVASHGVDRLGGNQLAVGILPATENEAITGGNRQFAASGTISNGDGGGLHFAAVGVQGHGVIINGPDSGQNQVLRAGEDRLSGNGVALPVDPAAEGVAFLHRNGQRADGLAIGDVQGGGGAVFSV